MIACFGRGGNGCGRPSLAAAGGLMDIKDFVANLTPGRAKHSGNQFRRSAKIDCRMLRPYSPKIAGGLGVELLGDKLVGELGIGFAAGLFQHLADEETEHFGFATLVLG